MKLQGLEFGEVAGKNVARQVAELRGLIPQPILDHYDRLRARDKKGVALVRNQVCTGCHLKQPIGKITVVMRGEDIQLCDSCGRYLYLEETEANAVPEPVEAPKPAPKRVGRPRKQKVLAKLA
jgi:predicted  nucleic acid-binding Zn-ribbon protein